MKKFLILLALFTLPVFAEQTTFANLNEYFQYLPNEVHKNWTPYKSDKDYEVSVQFRVMQNGEISDLEIVKSTNEAANTSVINAVKSGAPYAPLPTKFTGKSVKTQVELRYLHNTEN